MFKLGMSLVMAVIAALVVFIAALVGGARIGTVFLRSLCGFLLTSAVSWLVLFLLEAKGVVGFDRNLELPEAQKETSDEALSAAAREAGEDGAQDEAVPGDAASQQTQDAQAGEASPDAHAFAPLASDELTHVEAASGQMRTAE